jgi:hypothetical protein
MLPTSEGLRAKKRSADEIVVASLIKLLVDISRLDITGKV